MKSKNRLSLLLLTLITASLVLPSTLAQTTDRNRTPNQEALYARYTHNELMSYATSLFDNVKNTYYAYKNDTKIVLSERVSSSNLHDLEELIQDWQIENFPNSDNLKSIQRCTMQTGELIHVHRTNLNAYRQAVCYLIRDTEIIDSSIRSFVDEFKEIFYLHGMVLNTIDLLTDRLTDMNRMDFRDENLKPQPDVIINETNNSAYLQRRTLFVLERLWNYLPMVVNDFGGKLQWVLPSLDEQTEEKCIC